MKQPFLTFVLLGLFASTTAHATLIASDSFEVSTGNYLNDATLYGRNPADSNTGFGVAWSNENNQTTSNLRAGSEALSHNLVAGSTAAGSIFAVRNNTGRNVTRALDSNATTAIGNLISTNGTLYFSGLVGGQSWAHQTSGSSFVQLGLGADRQHSEFTTNGGVLARVGDNGAFSLTVTTSGGSTTNTSVGTLTAGETYLFTTRIEFNHSGGNHRITMDLYNAAANDYLTPTASNFFDVATADFGAAQLGYLVFNHNNTGGYADSANTPRYDEFRLGTSLNDVVVIPEPGTLALVGIALGSLLLFYRRR